MIGEVLGTFVSTAQNNYQTVGLGAVCISLISLLAKVWMGGNKRLETLTKISESNDDMSQAVRDNTVATRRMQHLLEILIRDSGLEINHVLDEDHGGEMGGGPKDEETGS